MFQDPYLRPEGISGQANIVKWCGRNTGGKRCNLCKHHAEYETWSSEWFFFYLIKWSNSYGYWHEFAHYRLWKAHCRKEKPVKYNIRAPRISEINTMMRKGCKSGKRCRCVSIIQRGYWYCPDCWKAMNTLADIRKQHPHDLMLMDRQELKKEMLVLKLSGVL